MARLKSSQSVVSVANFYANKSVFVTGFTGFLGKVLVEKLLYSCPDIENIYVLTRNKQELSSEQRISLVTKEVVFERIQKQKPEVLKKLVPITGDMMQPGLGISRADRSLLTQKVSVVLHLAASVYFFKPLKYNINSNVDGTLRLIDLCKDMDLDALVHVSTAFCNCDRKVIGETVYPPPAQLEDVREFADSNYTKQEMKKFLGTKPNNYTYTKALAEYEVMRNRGDIPTAIVRPPSVIASLEEPSPGWLDNWTGLSSYMHPSLKGVVRRSRGNPSLKTNILPVDLAGNAVIVAATQCRRSKELKVYNCCIAEDNAITWGRFQQLTARAAEREGLGNFSFPPLYLFRFNIVNKVFDFIIHTVPAYYKDALLAIQGKPTRYRKIKQKFDTMEHAYSYFKTNEWHFEDKNMKELSEKLSPEDRRLFKCLPHDIDWETYIEIYFKGIQKYMPK